MEPAQMPSDGLPVPQRYWSILSIALALLLAVLDSAIANVALPTIAEDLRASPADAIWIVNAYQIAIVISLLPLASLGDIVGYARIYRIGLAIFTVASLACAMSDSLMTLTLARVLQGFGAAGIMSMNGALVRFTYPHRQLGRGTGINAMVVAVSSAIGPTVAAAILAVAQWEWLFAVNVPIGIVALAIAWRALPESERSGRRFNIMSAVLNALTFGLVIMGIDWVTRAGQPLYGTLMLVAGLAAGALLLKREAGEPRPLVPLDLLRIPIFALSIATSICSFAAHMLAFVSLPFLFQIKLGRSAVDTGLLMTPFPLGIAFIAPLAGWLADLYSAAILGGLGLALFASGLALMALMPPDITVFGICWRMALCGIGFGLFQAPNNRTMLSAAPRARAGAAGGMLATARLTGQTAGATLVAILLTFWPAEGEIIALGVGACLAAAASALSFLRMTTPTVRGE